ncbi:MAG TPA: GNAT family N-acetyltransferase [Terrimicrobiaceae bacterium]
MPDLLVRLYDLPPSGPLLMTLRDNGIEVRRAIAAEKATVSTWIGAHFSKGWSSECEIAFSRQPIGCMIAVHEGLLLGFCCHGVVCPDFLGPLGVIEEWRQHNLGTALLLASLDALRNLGYAYAIIGWAGPVEFFVKTVGATIIENSEPGIYRGLLKD